MADQTPAPAIEVRDLTKSFRVNGREVHALNGVSISVGHAETLGIVGESGSGKSTLGRIVVGLETMSSGEILHEGTAITALGRTERNARLAKCQMIFQDPYASLNPRMPIGRQIHETLRAHGSRQLGQNLATAAALLERVGLPPDAAGRYPHEFSGGQRQRIAIARAISTSPSVIVADEAVSALDVSIREQILDLMAELKGTTSYLFISHDMAAVAKFCDRIAVMHKGRVVETGTTSQIISDPQDPYTQSLLEAVPRIGRRR